MNDPLTHRLSRIETSWHILQRAHAGADGEVAAALQLLIERYGPAVRRYLLAAVRNVDAADELLQEFSLTLVRSGFRNADPSRGRFRDYVKTVLFHLVSKHRRQRQKQAATLDADVVALADESASQPLADEDRLFYQSWRETLLNRTWDALADANATYHLVLRYRSEHADATSEQMAAELSQRAAKSMSAASVRQSVHRAREMFADLLVEEVARSLTSPSRESLRDELEELDLFKYCREAFARHDA